MSGSLYVAAPKIQPRAVDGRYARFRTGAALMLLGLFYLLPWMSWQGRPLVLFDLPARQFHLFGMILVPQDLYLLAGLLLIAAVTLFFFTSIGGRLWCGYACPQTVWTEAFRWIERGTEGDRHQRLKLDRMPWNAAKLRRRGTKHLLWLLFSLWTGLSFVGYFVPIRELIADLGQFEMHGWPAFWSVFYGVATWGNAGFMREQVCRYMCPYARFQGAMFDRDTLIIAYDKARGEPRKGQAGTAGDCINCTLCVQVCPTGIDIRDGLQYECIACAACVAACNGVMDRIGKPRGLVRYSSLRQDEEGRFRLLRPRALAYGVIWLILIGLLPVLVLTRAPIDLDVLADRHVLGRTLADGSIENIFTVKLINKTGATQWFNLSAVDEDGRPLLLQPDRAQVAPGMTAAVVLSARLPASSFRQPTRGVNFTAVSEDDPALRKSASARFVTGMK